MIVFRPMGAKKKLKANPNKIPTTQKATKALKRAKTLKKPTSQPRTKPQKAWVTKP